MSALADSQISPWYRARHVRRAQYAVTVTSGGVLLLAANPGRIGCIISSPNIDGGTTSNNTQLASAQSTATTGVKQSFTIPGGSTYTLTAAGTTETTATGVVSNLQLVRSSVTYNLGTVTTTGVIAGPVPLNSGDILQWNVTTAIATAVNDYWLGLSSIGVTNRVTLGFNNPAAIDQGPVLYPLGPPLILWKDVVGDALTEDIYAIARASNVTIGVWDLFY